MDQKGFNMNFLWIYWVSGFIYVLKSISYIVFTIFLVHWTGRQIPESAGASAQVFLDSGYHQDGLRVYYGNFQSLLCKFISRRGMGYLEPQDRQPTVQVRWTWHETLTIGFLMDGPDFKIPR
jgi:hypothetical protein